MRKRRSSTNSHFDPEMAMSLALVRYHFSTPEIRLLMRHVLGYALSGRTIKRLARSSGNTLKRGRPRTTPRVYKGDMNDLIQVTSNGIEAFGGNTLQFFHNVQVQFGLTPRQYLMWVAKFVRRGKCMLRRCLLCNRLFPSVNSGDRHCFQCRTNRRQLLKEKGESVFAAFEETIHG